jgi:hypothetical protein
MNVTIETIRIVGMNHRIRRMMNLINVQQSFREPDSRAVRSQARIDFPAGDHDVASALIIAILTTDLARGNSPYVTLIAACLR